jgi:hypothetical protein
MSKTLLEQLKDRKLLATKKPFIEFFYPSEEDADVKFRVKRISAVQRRQARSKLTAQDGLDFYSYNEEIFRRIMQQVESIHDPKTGKEIENKEETLKLMSEHFDGPEIDRMVISYSAALEADKKEAAADPNE